MFFLVVLAVFSHVNFFKCDVLVAYTVYKEVCKIRHVTASNWLETCEGGSLIASGGCLFGRVLVGTLEQNADVHTER